MRGLSKERRLKQRSRIVENSIKMDGFLNRYALAIGIGLVVVAVVSRFVV